MLPVCPPVVELLGRFLGTAASADVELALRPKRFNFRFGIVSCLHSLFFEQMNSGNFHDTRSDPSSLLLLIYRINHVGSFAYLLSYYSGTNGSISMRFFFNVQLNSRGRF